MDVLVKKEIFDEQIDSFVTSYKKNKQAINVSFRELVPNFNNQDRATHLIHPYPAKLLMHIPYFFLNNSILSKQSDIVLDPFSGSGTVLLESILAGRNAYGADANPLARLISSVKTSKYDVYELKLYLRKIEKLFKERNQKINKFPDVRNIDFWYLPHVKIQLAAILSLINEIEDLKIRDFFLVCFSSCSKKLSLADPRISVPVRLKVNDYPVGHKMREKNIAKLNFLQTVDVIEKFVEIATDNIIRLESLKLMLSYNNIDCNASLISNNAKTLLGNSVGEGSVDLIITSPPYAGAQKYIRSSSLCLGWTELATHKELKALDNLSIGRENYSTSEYKTLLETGIYDADKLLSDIYLINPLRAHIAANYLLEMKVAMKESVKVLKKGGYIVLIAANNQVCNIEFRTQEYLQVVLEELGLEVVFRLMDDIKSYGLMTKRNKTASIITREWVLVFQKK